MHWIWFHAGLKNGVYVWYLLWSGIAGCGVIGSGMWHNSYVNARKHNCHVHRCWRVGRLPVEGTGFTVCRRHHPDGAPSHEHVLARHRLHVESLTRLAQKPAGRRGSG